MVSVANALGVTPIFIFPGSVLFSAGFLFALLAWQKPKSLIYKHVAILVFGFVFLTAFSLHHFRGWAGL